MTRWAPFLWLTAVVVVLLLGLARLSSGVVRDGPADGSTDTGASNPATTRQRSSDADPGPPVGPHVSETDPARTPPDATIRPSVEAVSVQPADEPPGDPAVAPAPKRAESVQLSTGMLLANVALTQGLVGLAVVLGLWWFEIPGSAIGVSADPWIAGLPALGLGVTFGLALWVGNEAAAGVADAVGAGYDEAMRSMLAPDSLVGWAVLLGLVLPIVAGVEELLFRAAMIGVPAAGLGVSPWLLAVVSSVAFALGHGAQGRVGIVVTGILGFVLAAGYVVSGSLLVVVVAHYVVNAAEFVVHEGLELGRFIDS